MITAPKWLGGETPRDVSARPAAVHKIVYTYPVPGTPGWDPAKERVERTSYSNPFTWQWLRPGAMPRVAQIYKSINTKYEITFGRNFGFVDLWRSATEKRGGGNPQ